MISITFLGIFVNIIIIYLLNRGPSSSLDSDFPEEAWTGKKASYSFLNTFDCE
jgi:hypothetical protein